MKAISISDFFSNLTNEDNYNILMAVQEDFIEVPSNITILVEHPCYYNTKARLYDSCIHLDGTTNINEVDLMGQFSKYENKFISEIRLKEELRDNIIFNDEENIIYWIESYGKMHGRRRNTVNSALSQAVDKLFDNEKIDDIISYYNIIKDKFIESVKGYEKSVTNKKSEKQLEIIDELKKKLNEQEQALLKGKELPYITEELSLSKYDIIVDNTDLKNALYEEIDRLVYPLSVWQREILKYYMKSMID